MSRKVIMKDLFNNTDNGAIQGNYIAKFINLL
jgi:hypothetical protein